MCSKLLKIGISVFINGQTSQQHYCNLITTLVVYKLFIIYLYVCNIMAIAKCI